MRRRRFKPLLAAAALGVAAWRLSGGLQAGLLDYRYKHYYQNRIVGTRPALAHPARGDFMRPYDPELMLVLTENHVLEGYRGADLSQAAALTRFEVTFLLGRFIRQVNARDGRIFAKRRSTDHQAMWIPQKRWGYFETEDALCEGLMTPLWERNWWEGKVSRYQLAAEVGKLLRALAPHYELIMYFEIYPLEDITDFAMPGHPNVGISKDALQHGVMGAVDGRFRGNEPVSAHDMVEVLDRLITIVNGYQRKPATPLPPTLPDGSGDSFARPDPFPAALRTKYQSNHEIVDEQHEEIYQRPQFEKEPRDIREDP